MVSFFLLLLANMCLFYTVTQKITELGKCGLLVVSFLQNGTSQLPKVGKKALFQQLSTRIKSYYTKETNRQDLNDLCL